MWLKKKEIKIIKMFWVLSQLQYIFIYLSDALKFPFLQMFDQSLSFFYLFNKHKVSCIVTTQLWAIAQNLLSLALVRSLLQFVSNTCCVKDISRAALSIKFQIQRAKFRYLAAELSKKVYPVSHTLTARD